MTWLLREEGKPASRENNFLRAKDHDLHEKVQSQRSLYELLQHC